jgi:hypothetical protein
MLQAISLQGALGYSAFAAGLVGIPISVMLIAFSTSVGTLAARIGPRVFMTLGPMLMALGLLWYVRLPATSRPWTAAMANPSSLVPPVDFFVDVLPVSILFGAGICLLVAPLTTALMSSVPERNSGLASAINNAVSRIGPLIAGALIFVAVTATFYGTLADRVPGTNLGDPSVRRMLTPLNPPGDGATAREAEAANVASVDAFHVAMLLTALLCTAGAAVNGLGIRNPRPGSAAVDAGAEAAPPAS